MLDTPADNAKSSAAQSQSPFQRAWWWSGLVVLLAGWAGSIAAASHLPRLTGPISFSLCGPWGCTGPTEALLAYHAVWLMVLLPPGFVAGWLLPPDDARRWGWSLVGAGLTGSVILFAWGSIEWLLHASATRSLWLRRGLFVLVDQSDIPVVQILLSGVACLVAARRRQSPRVAVGPVGTEFNSAASAGSDASRHQFVQGHSRH